MVASWRFLAVVVTLFVGLQQLQVTQQTSSAQIEQIAQNREADQFDKAIGRLADRTSPSIRVAGVTGLRLLLAHADPSEQRAALRYLITAVVDEPSQDVLDAIVDTFGDAKSFDSDARDDALSTVVEFDRDITRTASDSYISIMDSRKTAFLKSLSATDRAAVPSGTLSTRELGFDEIIQLKTAYNVKLFAGSANSREQAINASPALPTYVKIINKLLASGAMNKSNNWSDIYCQSCDFSSVSDKRMERALFDRSFLEGANFSHVDLSGATFADADLALAMFFASNLTKARLDWSDKPQGFLASETNQTRNSSTRSFPFLECAILDGADLSGLPLVTIWREIGYSNKIPNSFIRDNLQYPSLRHAHIDHDTKANKLVINIKVTVDGEYLYSLTEEDRIRLEEAFLKPIFDWPQPIIEAQLAGNFFQRQYINVDNSDKNRPIRGLASNDTVQIYDIESTEKSVKALLTTLKDEPLFEQTAVTKEIISMSRPATGSSKPETHVGEDVNCQQVIPPDESLLQVWTHD